MWRKRGVNQIDWAISIGIFMIYISWFFLLIKPYYLPLDNLPLTDNLEDTLLSDLEWKVEIIPLIVHSDASAANEPVRANFTLGLNESDFAFSDSRYFTVYKDYLYFISDIKQGPNLFSIVTSDSIYNKTNIMTDLLSTEYSASVPDMRANFHNGVLTSIYYKGDKIIEDFKVMRHNIEVDANQSSFFSSKILSVHEIDTDSGFNHSSFVFSSNQRVNNRVALDSFIDNKTIMLNMKVKGFIDYYSNNADFGTIEYPSQYAKYNDSKIMLYNDEDVITFIIDAMEDETEISIGYSDDDEIELNITMTVEKEAEYTIYFDSLNPIKNGDFEQGTIGWNFAENINQYRDCSDNEGIFRILDTGDSFFSWDWSNDSISGPPIAGFGSDKAELTGSGGLYDGRLMSAPFTIPDDMEFLHVWRNFNLNGFDSHNSSPDAAYLEIRDTVSDELLLAIDSWEPAGDNQSYNLAEEEKNVNISALNGRNVRLSLNVIGQADEDISECSSAGADDDALVQLDDVYFSDENSSEIVQDFDYDNIISRIPMNVDTVFGIAEKENGIFIDDAEYLASISYEDIKSRYGFPNTRDFLIMINNSGTDYKNYSFGNADIPPGAEVFSSQRVCRILDKTGLSERCRLNIRVW